jgi:transposase
VSRRLKLNVSESVEELKVLLHCEKNALKRERIHALYLYQTGQSTQLADLALKLGRHSTTIGGWFKIDKTSNLDSLLTIGQGGGKSLSLDDTILKALDDKLHTSRGFGSYDEIKKWLKEKYELDIPYKTLYGIVYYKLNATPFVVRPVSCEQKLVNVTDFIKKYDLRLSILTTFYKPDKLSEQTIRFWCMDETRIGLRTITRRPQTAKGIKPVASVQCQYQAYHLYGMVEPLTGKSFFFELSRVDTTCFQVFLEEFSRQYPNDIHLVQLDNASFHTSKSLELFDNIILFFQPSYSPELNPVERVWEWIKDKLSWDIFPNLDALKDRVVEILKNTDQDIFASLTGWKGLLGVLKSVGF